MRLLICLVFFFAIDAVGPVESETSATLAPSLRGGGTILSVTHSDAITTLPDRAPQEGECAVPRPIRQGFKLLYFIKASEWKNI